MPQFVLRSLAGVVLVCVALLVAVRPARPAPPEDLARKKEALLEAKEKAHEILDCAHSEARSAYNGVGLVKLMGRDAGFIAAAATLANSRMALSRSAKLNRNSM